MSPGPRARADSLSDERAALSRRADSAEAPLSFSQERLWLLDELGAGAALNIPLEFRIRGRLDEEALVRALGAFAERHEALRTSFQVAGGRPSQRIHPRAELEVRRVDLAALPADDRDDAVLRLALEEVDTPFDLGVAPLVRAVLVDLGPDDRALVLTAHHIVWDRWSTGLFFRELTPLYEAFAAGRPDPLPPLALHYGDFAVWQRARLSGERLERELAFWRDRLDGLEPLDLPTDHPRPAVQGYRTGLVEGPMDLDVLRGLREIMLDAGVTLGMALCATWQAFLVRWARARDVAVGVLVANRSEVELEPMVGVFVNALVMRARAGDDPVFDREWLPRVRDAWLGGLEHQEVPFERLVEELAPVRDASRQPLFQVMFAMQNRRREELSLGEARIDPLGAEEGSPELTRLETIRTSMDLELRLVEHAGGGICRLIYDADLFERATIEAMASQLQTFLRGVVEEPGRRLSEFPLETATERAELDARNATETPARPAVGVDALVLDFARERPAATALIADGRRVEFGELAGRVDGVARALAARGVVPGDRVGLFVERSIDTVVGLLGTLRAGAAYVPLDPNHPDERLAHVVDDAALAAVLTQGALRSRLATPGLPTLLLDEPLPEAPALDPSRRRASGDDAAFVLFTSGSTGRPKGVVGRHRTAVNRIAWEQERLPWAPDEVACHKTNLAFIDSVHELLGPLAHGVPVVVPDEATARDARALALLCAEHGVTRLNVVPTFLAELVEVRERDGVDLSRLRLWTVTGERFPSALAARALACGPGTRVWNTYGSTEVGDATAQELRRGDPELEDGRVGEVLAGLPIANARVHVLDDAMRPVPVGVPGEVWVAGDGLATGYWNRPELDRASFAPDPFAGAGRLFRMRDLGRLRADGRLQLLGRLDGVVKVRGIRVELGEVEAVLARHPGVAAAAARVQRGEAGDDRLAAFVVPEGSAGVPADLAAWARARLPEAMVPAAIGALAELPRTSSGKVDRGALPELELRRGAGAGVAPRNGIEELVAAIWAELLSVERVGVRDDFFELGGHSLLATRAVSRVRAALDAELETRDLFVHRTVEELARLVEERRGGAARPALAPRPPGTDPAVSFAQERLWFLDELGAGGGLNVPLALRLRGALDVDALESALRSVVARHEALRAGLERGPDGPRARLVEGATLALERADLSGLAADAREAELARLAREAAERPFRLAEPPLMRALLVALGPAEHVLALTLHHAVCDGWSLGCLYAELRELHDAARRGEAGTLEPLAVQYGDYAAWQRGWLVGAELERQLAHWRDALAGLQPLELPRDRPRPEVQGFETGACDVALPKASADALRAIAAATDATPAIVALAAFQALLARVAGTEDVAVGSPIANRRELALEPLVGLFVNTLVLRADLSGDPRFASELVPRVREASLAAYAHQDLPFEKLVAELAPTRDASRHPLFQVAFAYQNVPREAPALEGLEVEELRLATARTALDLELRVLEREGGLACRFLYDADLFDAERIGRLAEQWARLVAGLAADPDARLSALPLLDGEERALLVEAWSGAAEARERAAAALVHEAFATHALAHPDVPALVFGERALSYAELRSRARGLATELVERGVRRGQLVGLCAERGVETWLGWLAVLDAGAACLPLDPLLPAERFALLVADARVELVLAQDPLGEVLAEHGVDVVPIDAEGAAPPPVPDAAPLVATGPEDLAYAIYTSGSTGTPKAALLQHGGLALVAAEQGRQFGIGPGARVLQFAAFAFDASVFELALALAHGATLVLGEPAALLPGEALHGFLERERIEVATLFPSAVAKLPERPLPDLRVLLVAGEACTREIVEAWAPGRRFFNLYGPTEATIWTTAAELTAGEPVHIGRPIRGARVYVLDRWGELAPRGVPGELAIGGEVVARSYHRRDELTAQRFVPDRFVPGGRLYRTGDLVRFRADGHLESLGRIDHQVKIRGHRVELGEVEAALAAHPDVREAVATVDATTGGEPALAAYFEASAELDGKQLRPWLAERLPTYLVPTWFVRLDALPRGATGKVDRSALPSVDPERQRASEYEAPSGPTEEALAAIWSEALGVDRVGRFDHFYDIGGHSLLSISVVARVEERLGKSIRPGELLLGNLAQVAAVCDAAEDRRSGWVGRLARSLGRWFAPGRGAGSAR